MQRDDSLPDQTTYLIALGSSIGNREAYLKAAVEALQTESRGRVTKCSAVYETSPIGPAKNGFLNCCLLLECDLDPNQLLAIAHKIEESNSRVRDIRWDDRTLDIDILLFQESNSANKPAHVCKSGLSIPHPRMLDRDFVLVPACEVASDWQHPVYRLTLAQICDRKCYKLENKTDIILFPRIPRNPIAVSSQMITKPTIDSRPPASH